MPPLRVSSFATTLGRSEAPPSHQQEPARWQRGSSHRIRGRPTLRVDEGPSRPPDKWFIASLSATDRQRKNIPTIGFGNQCNFLRHRLAIALRNGSKPPAAGRRRRADAHLRARTTQIAGVPRGRACARHNARHTFRPLARPRAVGRLTSPPPVQGPSPRRHRARRETRNGLSPQAIASRRCG